MFLKNILFDIFTATIDLLWIQIVIQYIPQRRGGMNGVFRNRSGSPLLAQTLFKVQPIRVITHLSDTPPIIYSQPHLFVEYRTKGALSGGEIHLFSIHYFTSTILINQSGN